MAIYALQVFSFASPVFVWFMAIPVQAGFSTSMSDGGNTSYGFFIRLVANLQIGTGGPPGQIISINFFAIFMIWWLWKRYKIRGQGEEIDQSIFE